MQIGWSTLDMVASSSAGNGIGDDRKSWAYDGRRLSKWHGDQSRYSSKRWQAGDIVGVAVDLDNKVMRYFLNGEDLGVAFVNFDLSSSPNHALRPSCSFASGERARFVFDAAHFQSSMPPEHFPLQGDKPMPRNNPIGRAHSITCNLAQLGLTAVWRDLPEGCYSMASKLAAKGVVVTVVLDDAFQSMLGVDSLENDTTRPQQKFMMNGHLATAVASEYISLARFLLMSSHSSRAWADNMTSVISSMMDGFCSSPDRSSARLRQLLGSVCVLGGFMEPLRVGSVVDIDVGGLTAHQGVVIDYSPGQPFAQVGMTKSGNDHSPQIWTPVSADNPALDSSSSQTASLLHRIRIDKLRTRSLFVIDLACDFPLNRSHVTCLLSFWGDKAAQAALPPIRWLHLELGIRAFFVLEALLHTTSPKSDTVVVKLVTKAFVRLARLTNGRNFEFDRVRSVFDLGRERLWDLTGQVLGWFAMPCIRADTKTSAYVQLPPSPKASVAEIRGRQLVYGSSAYLEESGGANRAANDDTWIQRMVRYWEVKIIPIIQDYVRGSFRDYEMAYFFEQLRQPLRAGDAVSAMKIA